MTLGTFFKDIGKGILWLPAQLAKLPHALNKLITLSNDAKDIASDAAKDVITVCTDTGELVAAIAKDDGASLKAIETFIAAAGAAIAAKGLNWQQDAAVIVAAEEFFSSINGTNYADVLAALSKLITDGKTMTATVLADFKKLEADVTA